jgi:hypothetical protein
VSIRSREWGMASDDEGILWQPRYQFDEILEDLE